MKLNIEYKNLKQVGEYKHCIICEPFRIFYNLNGDTKTPKKISYTEYKNMPSYIIELLKSFYKAYMIFLKKLELKTPLKEGIYFDSGAKFIDILIVNIPVQKGLVAAEVIDNSSYFVENKFHGKSIKIQLHNNLIENTATPIHELFHVFQYNYCNFNNMWFMEGLARLVQNLTHKRDMIDEELPQNIEQLEYLLSRAHDAEYFFRRLLSFFNNKLKFVKTFLQECEDEDKKLQNKYNITWKPQEKKDKKNNRYILLALLNTLKKLDSQKSQELDNFIITIKKFIDIEHNLFLSDEIQRFLKVLKICNQDIVYEKNGFLYCDNFDIETKTLEIKNIDLSKLNIVELETFDMVENIKGDILFDDSKISSLNVFNSLQSVYNITIKNCKDLSKILGFNSLTYIKNIEISNNENLQKIHGFFKFFNFVGEIEGYIKIINNRKLENISFFLGLKKVGSSFYLHHNHITSLHGLENLENVGASFSLGSNYISDLLPLSKLSKIKGMLGLVNNQLTNLDGLENLKMISIAKWNNQFRSLALNNNKNLVDLRALKNIKSDTGHCIIYIDMPNEYRFPEKEAEFYKQTLELYDKTSKIDTKKIFPSYKKYKPKILFTPYWKENLSKMDYITPFFSKLNDIDFIIKTAKINGIDTIYPQLVSDQYYLLEHQEQLTSLGIKFVSNNKFMMRICVNKKRFYKFMIDNNMDSYIPKYYEDDTNIDYPVIIKKETGWDGKNSKIIFSKKDDVVLKEDEIRMEFIKGEVEYATNIVYKDGEILNNITYKRTNENNHFILNRDSHGEFLIEKVETPFKNIFKKILSLLVKDGSFTQCCFDYKIVHGKPKIFEINARLGLTLFTNNIEFENFIKLYINEIDIKYSKKKLIVSDTWNNTFKSIGWLEPIFTEFKNIDKFLESISKKETKDLYGQVYSAQRFLYLNQTILLEKGYRFLVNDFAVVNKLINKRTFFEHAIKCGFEKMIPKYYPTVETIEFPCIIKEVNASNGDTVRIVYNQNELGKIKEKEIVNEYISGKDEYASNIFYKDGKILCDVTYKKSYNKNFYVLNNDTKYKMTNKRIENPFKEDFIKLINSFTNKKGILMCCIDYKVIDNIPKIFEINVRFGYTLFRYEKDLKEMFNYYFKEVEYVK